VEIVYPVFTSEEAQLYLELSTTRKARVFATVLVRRTQSKTTLAKWKYVYSSLESLLRDTESNQSNFIFEMAVFSVLISVSVKNIMICADTFQRGWNQWISVTSFKLSHENGENKKTFFDQAVLITFPLRGLWVDSVIV